MTVVCELCADGSQRLLQDERWAKSGLTHDPVWATHAGIPETESRTQ